MRRCVDVVGALKLERQPVGEIGEIAPRWRLPLLGVAAIVALSRVVNRDHFLSDVTAAAFIAIMAAYYLAPYVLGGQYRWVLRAPWRWWRRDGADVIMK